MEKINSYKSTNGLGIRTELKMQCPMLAASKSKVFLASILFCLSLGTIFFTNHARAEEGMATSTPLEGGVPEIMVGEDSFSFTNPTITNLAITGTTVAQGRLASIGRKLARTADGLLHAVYIRSDGTHDQVYYSYSSNDGQSWVEEQITTASRNHDYPVIATDANNSIHLAWVHCQEPAGFGKTCIVQYRLKTSAGWQPVEDVLTGYLHAPAMAIDSQNNVHLVVRGYSPGAYNCDYLKYTKRTASGWSPTERVSSVCWATRPAIAVDHNDSVHIAYGHTPSTYYNLIYRKRTSLAWEAEQELESSNSNGGEPSASLTVDEDNVLHLGWLWKQPGVAQYAIKYRKFTAAWQPIETPTGIIGYQQLEPTLAADGNNNLHLLWPGRHAGSPTAYQIRHLRSSISWQPIENLTSASIDQLRPSLLFASWPQINILRPNVLQAGYAFLWNDGPVVKFYKNQPPTFSNPQQYKPDGATSIEEGATITEDEVVFRGTLNDSDGDLVKLQVELREASQPFTGVFDGGILEGDFIAPGGLAAITSPSLLIGDYHWRARAMDARGGVSDWQEFGQLGNVDFAIRALPQLSMEVPSMFKSDGLTRLDEGALTTENVVVLSATTTSPSGNQVRLEAQVRVIGSPPFQDTDPILSGSFVNSGSQASVTIEVPAEIQYDPAEHPYRVRVRAADNQGNRSDWLELGQAGNTDFEVKMVPLYTQVTSDFPSATLTAQWAAEPYGTGNYTDCLRRDRDTGQPVPNSSTIGRCGCAITSVVMMLRYYNIMKNADSEDVDPITLNTWLTNPPAGIAGYDPHGNLTNAWASIPFYAADQSGRRRIVFEGKHNISDGLFSSEALLRDQIDVRLTTSLPQPVILYEAGSATAPDHFIVATGKLATTYNIRDPRWYKTKYLSQAISGPDERNYANSFTGLRLYRPVAALDPVPSFLAASVASPVELLITDPIGRRVGWDPVSGQIFSEIAAASYTEEGISDPTTDAPQAAQHRSKSIWIPEPLGGQYALKVVGTDTGGYTLNAFVGDSHGKPEEKILAGNTASDVVAAYNINFNAQDAQALTIAPQDTTPPITTLTALGMQGKNDWMITPAEITLAAEDNPGGVGVFKTEYSLDNGETWILYGGPFVIEDDGANLVAYRSEDFVGNKEEAKFSFVRIDTTPPEARASFDPVSLSIKVEGIDNLSQPTISQNGSTYTLEDLAGNTTAIVLEETKQAGKQFKAGLKSIQYGNQPPIVLNADLKAEWSLEKDGTLKELTQQLQARHFKVEAKYQGKKDETSIKADTEQGGGHETRETLPHLRVAKLVTENGALTYGILIAPFSVEFNGVDSFLSRSSSPSLTLTSDFTLEAWVKILEEPAPNQSYVLVSKWEPTQNKRSYLWLYQKTASGDKQLTLCTSQAGSSFVCVAVNTRFAPLADLGVNEWHHVAARLIATSPGQPALFVDGQNIGGGITLPVPAVNDSPFTIGAGRAASGAPFFPCNCRMDEVRVWNVARTDDQIASGRFHELTSQEPNLAGYWSFAKNFLDVSPNRNDLVSQNVVFSLDSPPLAGAPVSTFASVERSLLATLPANISSATSWLMQVVRGFLR